MANAQRALRIAAWLEADPDQICADICVPRRGDDFPDAALPEKFRLSDEEKPPDFEIAIPGNRVVEPHMQHAARLFLRNEDARRCAVAQDENRDLIFRRTMLEPREKIPDVLRVKAEKIPQIIRVRPQAEKVEIFPSPAASGAGSARSPAR